MALETPTIQKSLLAEYHVRLSAHDCERLFLKIQAVMAAAKAGFDNYSMESELGEAVLDRLEFAAKAVKTAEYIADGVSTDYDYFKGLES